MANINSYAGIEAQDRAGLLSAFDMHIEPYDGPFIKVVLPCGHVREWYSREVVPEHTVECGCGELLYRHYFILYTGEQDGAAD